MGVLWAATAQAGGMGGEWVKNVRASGEAHIISGRRRKVKLEEVPIERRAPIIKEYIRLAPGGRPHIGLGTAATLADCQRVAPNHPVFRILYQNGPNPSHCDQPPNRST